MQKLRDKYRYSVILLRELAITDFKLRYEGSTLGYLWSVLKPLSLFAVLYLVFGVFLPISKGIPNFPVYLILGVVLWNFFVEVTKTSTAAIVGRASLIRKISFPRYVIVLSTTISALINLGINAVIVAIFLVFSDVQLSLNALWIVPIIIQLFLLSLGVGLILSALYVRLRDVNFVWDVVMQAAFYAVPIIYDIRIVSPEYVQKILMMNPVAQIIQDARYALLSPETETIATVYENGYVRLIPIAVTLLVFVYGVYLFKKRSPSFAEEV